MAREIIFRTLSYVFGKAEKEAWGELTAPVNWQSFCDALIDLAGKAPFVQILSAPPSYEEHQAFAARCLAGGLPTSALPVESLYCQEEGSDGPCYLQKPALYMRHLIEGAGLEVPHAFAATPDHLSLELEMVALYLSLDLESQAKQLFRERSAWLPAYRAKLASSPACAPFYLACVDALVALSRDWA